ncbi:MAG: hypothetical protein SV775_15895, partial [Thermodesulfobacteriota bacterium]|nr:hypothetical protein [Thermodesulfobacteriota bacterium]
MKDLIGVACILKIGVFVLLLSNGCGKNIHPYLSAPILLPDTMPEMNAPGFWIGLHPRPDKVIMSVKEIQLLNRFIRDELGSVKDIAHYPPVVSRYKVNDLITSQLINVE